MSMPDKNDQFYREISESIKVIFDVVSRLDERLKILVEQHSEVNQRIEKIIERHENIMSRLGILENSPNMRTDVSEIKKDMKAMEIDISAIKIHNAGHDNKWKLTMDFIIKTVLIVIGAVIAWKLGK